MEEANYIANCIILNYSEEEQSIIVNGIKNDSFENCYIKHKINHFRKRLIEGWVCGMDYLSHIF